MGKIEMEIHKSIEVQFPGHIQSDEILYGLVVSLFGKHRWINPIT
jgi:hypothetical protein